MKSGNAVSNAASTSILVYAHDGGAGVKHEAANALIARLGREAAGALSTQILIEF